VENARVLSSFVKQFALDRTLSESVRCIILYATVNSNRYDK
jgi:hypothetical protein